LVLPARLGLLVLTNSHFSFQRKSDCIVSLRYCLTRPGQSLLTPAQTQSEDRINLKYIHDPRYWCSELTAQHVL